MTTTTTYQGMEPGAKSSSRVLQPPGGGSNISFGTDEEKPGTRKNRTASNIFAEPDDPHAHRRNNPPGLQKAPFSFSMTVPPGTQQGPYTGRMRLACTEPRPQPRPMTDQSAESPQVSCVESLQPHSGDAMPSLLCRTILCLRRPSLGMENKRSQALKTQRSRRMHRSPARGPRSSLHPHRPLGARPAGGTLPGASPVSSWVEHSVLDLPHPNEKKSLFATLFVSHTIPSSCPLFLYFSFFFNFF